MGVVDGVVKAVADENTDKKETKSRVLKHFGFDDNSDKSCTDCTSFDECILGKTPQESSTTSGTQQSIRRSSCPDYIADRYGNPDAEDHESDNDSIRIPKMIEFKTWDLNYPYSKMPQVFMERVSGTLKADGTIVQGDGLKA